MENIKIYIKKYNKRIISGCIIAILFLVAYYTLSNDYSFYHEPVVKIISESSNYKNTTDAENGNSEKYFTQNIKGEIMNGRHKGETVNIQNEYSNSGVKSEKYRKGDKVFVEIKQNQDQDGGIYAVIINEKRDNYLFLLVGIVVLCMIFISRKVGILTIISLAINITMIVVVLNKVSLNAFMDYWWIVIAIVFIISTLLLVSGIKKKTFGAILSTIITEGIILGVYSTALYQINDVPYDMMEYIFSAIDFEKIYMISVIFGSLGAIMDVAVTINSSVAELVRVTPDIPKREIVDSVRQIGYDIMGTMINVLFFSYISSSLPIVILMMHSGYAFDVIIKYTYVFDILRFLVGSIGIVLSIPISGFIAYGLTKVRGESK